ncbi:MAG: TonB-dependent receptor [Candidatus Krumholzibacteriia bacterium]
MRPLKALLLVLMPILVSLPAPLAGQESPGPAAGGVTEIADLVVSSEAAAPPATGVMVIPAPEIEAMDPASLADIGGLLPSTRVAVNSRGESYLMIRGAPERHVQTFLDGIPLGLPWDDRVDLESIPITGDSRLEGRRGLASLLEGPGVLAGSVRILAPEAGEEARGRTSASLGQSGLTRFGTTYHADSGSWKLLGAGGWQDRASWPLPQDHPAATGDDERQNSDLDQYSLLLRGSRPVGAAGRLNLLATGWHQKKGVPAELNMGDDARFWRFPARDRVLVGASLHLPVGHDGVWDVSAMAALDYFDQEIDPRGPDGWGAPLEDGQDYEQNFDRTGHGMLGVTRWITDTGRVTLQGNARYTHHRESLTVGGGTLAYAQWVWGLVCEGEFRPREHWTIRGGAGIDLAATPETGDKPDRSGDSAEALNLRVQRQLGRDTELYGSISRRSRFPSLREMFSGALGKFEPNPDLRPERQDLAEIGLAARGRDWSLSTTIFHQTLDGGIEKVKIPGSDGRFMRVNRTSIRVPGWEAAGSWRPAGDVWISAQHTILAPRTETPTGFDAPAEDRPDYMSRLGIGLHRDRGPGARVEAALTGPRWSADGSGASDAAGGLLRLPAGVTWNARAGYRWVQDGRAVELHLRVDNLFDQWVDSQVGLPQPGRVVSGGLSLSL